MDIELNLFKLIFNSHSYYRPQNRKPQRFEARKPVIDARNKIIQKNRSKIVDARDKLAQITKRSGDARLKIIKKLKTNNSRQPFTLHTVKKSMGRRHLVPDRRPPPMQKYNNELMDAEDEYMHMAPGFSLRRTVKNDIFGKMPPLPTFPRSEMMHHPPPPSHMWSSDPFDCYEVPVGRPADVSEPKNLQRHIQNVSTDMMPRKGILRSTHRERLSPGCNYNIEDNSHLSYEMRARLERPPDTNVSMGIFSNPYVKNNQSLNGYRIVVSNLHSSVSQSDIKV